MTPLAWSVCWILPDIFVGLLILSLATLVSFHFSQQGYRNWCVIWLSVLCSVMQAVSILLLISISVAITTMTTLCLFRFQHLRAHIYNLLLSLSIVIGLSILANLAINGAIHHRISILTPYGWGNALFALNKSGLVAPYLNTTCEKDQYRLCQFKETLPHDQGNFLWATQSPFNKLGGFSGMEDESRQIVLGIVMQQPTLVAKHLWQSLENQLVMFDACLSG